MQFTAPKNSNNNSLFIHILVVVLGLAAGYLYYSQFTKPNEEPPAVISVNRQDSLSKFKRPADFNFNFFSEPAFRTLKHIGEYPVQAGPLDQKSNPFLP